MSKRKTRAGIRKIVSKMRSGKSRERSVLENLSEQVKGRVKKNVHGFSVEDMKYLKRLSYPKKRSLIANPNLFKKLIALKKKSKQRIIEQTFGLRGNKLGFLVIQPEFMGQTKHVRRFLSNSKCKIVFSKNIIFSKLQLYGLFGHRQMQIYNNFPVTTQTFLSSPSKIVVFKHPSKEEYFKISKYLKHLKINNPKEYQYQLSNLSNKSRQTIFDKLFKGEHEKVQLGTIRGDIVYPWLVGKGFEKGGTNNKREKMLDPLEYLKKHPDLRAMSMLGGVHSPKETELFREVAVLLTIPELKRIRQRLA